LILLGLLDGRPKIDWVGQRLGMSRRTLQRQLYDRTTTFDGMVRNVLMLQAFDVLRQTDAPITEVAYELGYSDPAHFTRAFYKWMGLTPRGWRSISTLAQLQLL
jgi:AraC-like DNA-binding protein